MDNSLQLSEDGKTLIALRNKELASLKIPEGVVRINEFAFQNNASLKEIRFPKSLMYIEKQAFNNCSELRKVCLYGNIDTISEGSFGNCIKLQGVFISDSIKTIGKEAFSGCPKLKYVYVMSKNPSSIYISPDWLNFSNGIQTIYVPWGTFNNYKQVDALKGFKVDITEFNVEAFVALFPYHHNFENFFTTDGLKNYLFPIDINEICVEPDYVFKNNKLYSKEKIMQVLQSEDFMNRYYTVDDIKKKRKWTNEEIELFLQTKSKFYDVSTIERIEASLDFMVFRRSPIEWIKNNLYRDRNIISKIKPTFFKIKELPQNELIEIVYNEYLNRSSRYLSFKEFNDNLPLRKSQIIAYLRHNCTEYDTLMRMFNKCDGFEWGGIDRDILHNVILKAIIQVYPWLK